MTIYSIIHSYSYRYVATPVVAIKISICKLTDSESMLLSVANNKDYNIEGNFDVIIIDTLCHLPRIIPMVRLLENLGSTIEKCCHSVELLYTVP